MNLVPGFGDHVVGFALIGGVLAAYIKALKTGIGERVTASLLHTYIFAQGVMLMAEQYPEIGESFPIDHKKLNNPFNNSYRTADDRYVQTCCQPFNLLLLKYLKTIGREDLGGNPRYTIDSIAENDLYEEFSDILEEAYAKKTAKEWEVLFKEADIPFSICQTFREILTDPQVEANNVFYEPAYEENPNVRVIRQPVKIGSELYPFERAPFLGEHSEEILKGLGYSDAEIKELHEQGVYSTWEELKAEHNG